MGLNVRDLAQSVRFYHNLFGFDLVGGEPGHEFAFLGQDGSLVLTLRPQSEGRAAVDRPGLHHLSFRVDSLEDELP